MFLEFVYNLYPLNCKEEIIFLPQPLNNAYGYFFRKNDQVFNFSCSEIEKATTSIKVAVAWFTDPELLKLLLNQRDEKRIAAEVILYNVNSKLVCRTIMYPVIHIAKRYEGGQYY